MTKKISLVVGPLFFIILNNSGSQDYFAVLGLLIWMLIWWTSQAVPLGITSLLPLLILPLFTSLESKSVSSHYANPIIYLFFGGFVLSIAIEKWKLHQRLALNLLKLLGNKSSSILLGMMLSSAFLSMWISNTASTLMMLPIGLSVIEFSGIKDKHSLKKLRLSVLLGIAFAANIGGMSTLIGTPPNLVLAAFSDELLNQTIYFSDWFLFASPLSLILLTITFFILKTGLSESQAGFVHSENLYLTDSLKKLGKLSIEEKRVSIVFFITAALWILRPYLNKHELLSSLNDTSIALASAISLFIIPTSKLKKKTKTLLQWKDMKRMPWEILLLFGAGISVASAMSTSGLMEIIGNYLVSLNLESVLLILLFVTFVGVFFTEFMSNVALVSVFVPVIYASAQVLNLDPNQLAIVLTLGASCAFMLPIATPPNAIVFGSGKIKMSEMIRIGIVLNLVAVLLITVYAHVWNKYFTLWPGF